MIVTDITPNLFISPSITNDNMAIGFNCPEDLSQYAGGKMGAFIKINGKYKCVGLHIIQNSFFPIALWGSNKELKQQNGCLDNQQVQFAILYNNKVIYVDEQPKVQGYVKDDIHVISHINFK